MLSIYCPPHFDPIHPTRRMKPTDQTFHHVSEQTKNVGGRITCGRWSTTWSICCRTWTRHKCYREDSSATYVPWSGPGKFRLSEAARDELQLTQIQVESWPSLQRKTPKAPSIQRHKSSDSGFNHPQTIMHPILTFSLDLLWDRLAACLQFQFTGWLGEHVPSHILWLSRIFSLLAKICLFI
jgi:hypothetical protein